ncbi:TPA: type-F conjugative transfer system pilin assembly protein TrbC [Pasteurella multocida]|nr:type-F conjugative transfer system pilin assembly protein TrbC [Pasteurella multocida]
MEKKKLCSALIIILFALFDFNKSYANENFDDVKPLDISKSELAYFVSFSIPEEQLVNLIRMAERKDIPVYINGLINNSMKQTARAILYLVNKYNIKGVLVDPYRFEYYGIKSVPALVKKCDQDFDVLFGNLNIEQSIEIINQEGDCK